MIITITGAAGVGKTGVVKRLRNALEPKDYLFYNFDSIEKPPMAEMIKEYGSPIMWQKAKTLEWISRLVEEHGDKTIVFEGQMNIDFILEGFKKKEFSDFKIVLLDCTDQEMRRRLIKEKKQPELANKNMSNLLVYLRNQATQKEIKIFDTTKYSKEDMLNRVLKFIKTATTTA